MSRALPGGSLPAVGSTITRQRGMVVIWNDAKDANSVYSPVSGMAVLPKVVDEHAQDWIQIGALIEYDCKLNSNGHWAAANIKRVSNATGFTRIDGTGLLLEVAAIVCNTRSQPYASEMWLWNDIIGRIYVPPENFCSYDDPFTAVKCVARFDRTNSWKHGGEDVPWTACNVQLVDPSEAATAMNNIGASLRTAYDFDVVPVIPAHGLVTLTNGEIDVFAGSMDFKEDLTQIGSSGQPLFMEGLEKLGVSYVSQIGHGTPFNRAIFVSLVEDDGCRGSMSSLDEAADAIAHLGVDE